MIDLLPRIEADYSDFTHRLSGEGKLLIAIILRALQDLGTDKLYSEFGRYISASESAWDFLNSKECKHICSLLGIQHAGLVERASELLERSSEEYKGIKVSELRRGR